MTHFQKLVTSKIPPSLARLIGQAHPEIVPVFEVISETLDDALRYKIEQAVDKLAKDAVSQPSDVARDVQATADEIAKDANIEVTKAQATAGAKQALNIDTEIKEGNRISADLKTTARRLKTGKLDRMLARLRSTSAAERERAIDLLAANGGDLTKEQVTRLRQMLRSDETWQTGADRPEGHHCTDYEYKTLGYYSGRAIQRIESPYVDDSLRADARRAESKGSYSRRVTDPGWV